MVINFSQPDLYNILLLLKAIFLLPDLQATSNYRLRPMKRCLVLALPCVRDIQTPMESSKSVRSHVCSHLSALDANKHFACVTVSSQWSNISRSTDDSVKRLQVNHYPAKNAFFITNFNCFS